MFIVATSEEIFSDVSQNQNFPFQPVRRFGSLKQGLIAFHGFVQINPYRHKSQIPFIVIQLLRAKSILHFTTIIV
jgi:hypothetical protein